MSAMLITLSGQLNECLMYSNRAFQGPSVFHPTLSDYDNWLSDWDRTAGSGFFLLWWLSDVNVPLRHLNEDSVFSCHGDIGIPVSSQRYPDSPLRRHAHEPPPSIHIRVPVAMLLRLRSARNLFHHS